MGRVVATLIVLGVLLALMGCSKPSPLVPVSGWVMLEGKPVPEVIVTFTPIGDTLGSGSVGGTDAEGRFTLTDVRGSSGAYVGEYKVSLYPAPTGAKVGNPADVVTRGGSSSVPGIYIDPNQTPLRATVPVGGGAVEILLTKTGQGATTKTQPAGK